MGTDLDVVQAARVSFAKDADSWDKKRDTKLIDYLAKHDHWCYDDKTEVFTDKGWVNFSDITTEDKVASVFGWENNEFHFSFVNPEQVHRTYYEGHMYEYESNCLSYSVTPHHKMLVKHRDRYGLKEHWEINTSDVLYGKEKLFQTTAKMTGSGDTYLNNLGKLYGFLLGDGFYPRNYETRKTVYCRLKKIRKIKYLSDLLLAMGINFNTKVTGDGVTVFTIKFECELYNEDGDKYFPTEVAIKKGVSFCEGMFDGLLNSDGSVKRNTYAFSSSSRPLFELFCIVGTVSGYNVLEGVPQDGDRKNKTYRGMVQTRQTVFTNKSKAKYKETINSTYKGYVSCVTVPTGMLLVRREGKQMVCGNTKVIDIL